MEAKKGRSCLAQKPLEEWALGLASLARQGWSTRSQAPSESGEASVNCKERRGMDELIVDLVSSTIFSITVSAVLAFFDRGEFSDTESDNWKR
jgi:hypothetical protein